MELDLIGFYVFVLGVASVFYGWCVADYPKKSEKNVHDKWYAIGISLLIIGILMLCA